MLGNLDLYYLPELRLCSLQSIWCRGWSNIAQIKNCDMTSAMLVKNFFILVLILVDMSMQVEARRQDVLQDKHLKVAAVPWSPFIMFYCNEKEIENFDDCPDKDNITYGGVLWELLNMVKLARNVTFSILTPPTPTWGYY